MSTRRRERGMLASPVLIGAVTVLVAIVAVFLAYNANNGLPFVPRYVLHVQVADAEELTQDAEVHMQGGALVGHLTSISPGRTATGQPIAVLNLALLASWRFAYLNSIAANPYRRLTLPQRPGQPDEGEPQRAQSAQRINKRLHLPALCVLCG